MPFTALLLANQFHRNVRCGLCGKQARYSSYVVTVASILGAIGLPVALGSSIDQQHAFHPQRFGLAVGCVTILVMAVFAFARLHPAPAPRKKTYPLLTFIVLVLILILVMWQPGR